MMNNERNQKSESIYSLLQQLPIMSGASVARIRDVAGRLRLNFRKVAEGDTVVAAGEQSVGLLCVLSGAVECRKGASTVASEGPQMLFPETLFGLDTRYPRSVVASSEVSVLEIPKDEFRKLLGLDPVFMLNYLNAVCTRAQRAN